MENNEVVTETVKTEENAKTEKTFTRDEFNSALAGEKKRIREEIMKEVEAEKSEAEKLAKMKADEKKDYEIAKANKRADEFEAELNAFKLEREALNIAEEKGVNSKLLSLIDFKTVKAEEVESKINNIKDVITAEVERIVNDKLKENTPKTVVGETKTTAELPKFF